MQAVDVVVIGGGILGLATAWEAAERGKRVALIDRSPDAQGASVRNFGMVWPIGQLPGEQYQRALHSRERWITLRDHAGIWLQECGSLHLVYRPEELAVIEEFAAQAKHLEIQCELLTPSETLRRVSAVNANGLLAALYSPTECVVDPQRAIRAVPPYLAKTFGVQLYFGRTVVGVDMPKVHLAGGDVLQAEQVFVCSGADFETLFPDVLQKSGIRRCKLQMMRTVSQPGGWRIGPHLAGGLTLGHYRAFEVCSSLAAMKAMHAKEHPEHGRLGIHVMASQNSVNEVIIGDSHEYDGDITPFDQPHIDELILSYLKQMVHLPEWKLAARWNGTYAKHPTKPLFTAQPQPGCYIVNAPGGAGMTMSFGNMKHLWQGLDHGYWPE